MKTLIVLLFSCFSIAGFSQEIPSLKVEELVKRYSNAKGVTVVNFWSTWCKPCQEEMPHFIKITDSLKMKGVNLLLVSLDTKTVYTKGELKAFVKKKKWVAPMVWLNETDADHYCPAIDKSWSGVIPVTLISNPSKNYFKFYEAALSREELTAGIVEAL
ncbi:MAG: TlpA disulfide reductase family protein [Bacteroidota bacterium]